MSYGEIPAISEDISIRIEEPGDWHSQEGKFAKSCSEFGWGFISLSDRDKHRQITEDDRVIFSRLEKDFKLLWGE